MTYQTYSNPYAARTARQTTQFKDPSYAKPASTVFSQRPATAPTDPLTTLATQQAKANGANPAAPPAAPSSLYDPSTDPTYQAIRQLGTRNVSDAVAGADAIRKRALISLGDPAFAHQQQFGDPSSPVYGDTSTEQAAAQNPYSTMAQLSRGHTQNVSQIDQALNHAGGYYSSTHANQLGDEATRYHQGITDATAQTGNQLSSVIDQILAAKNAAAQANISGLGTATQNAINTAIAGGYSFQGYDANGQPILAKPAPAGGATGGATGGDTGAAGGQQSGGGGIADPAAYPGILAALLTPEANAARQRGQRGEYINPYS